jgi:Histidine kinase-, DNA gyrase B-, and HSP90-like ATPase
MSEIPKEEEWKSIHPRVSAEAEFFEIVHDFGNPLEILREAISNAVDWGATWVKITFAVQDFEGNPRLFIIIEDNGQGMPREVLEQDFWGLGYSRSREAKKDEEKIGEKGHGTKIYLRSEKVIVRTQNNGEAFCSECNRPLSSLAQGKLHEPKIKQIQPFLEKTGTEITIIGYNDNERTQFVQRLVKDYLLWFTKIGSVEKVFGIEKHKNFKVILKALDVPDYETIPFGHVFPEETPDINKLFEEKKGASAADWYVKRYKWQDRLVNHPEVTFDVVIYIEGDQAKRNYNPMIRDRRRSDTGRYRVTDRYGIWLCKDYIPISRVNDWISGFGTGSNSVVLLHGFVNCQALKLTANRGDIANTDAKILEEIKSVIAKYVNEIDLDLRSKDLYTLQDWHEQELTLQQEKAEFTRRLKGLKGRETAKLDGRLIIEPKNESELFGLFMTVYALHPELFEFEPVDYNTKVGIDVIARNKSDNKITEGEHWYVELKYKLAAKRFNHAYQHLRWILCWDFDETVTIGTSEFSGVEDNDNRRLQAAKNPDGHSIYFLDSNLKATKIQIIRLKEFLKERLNVDFGAQKA